MNTLLIEVQGKKVLLWINSELLGEWRAGHTYVGGKPLEQARIIEKALSVCNVPCEIEFGDGCEDLKDSLGGEE